MSMQLFWCKCTSSIITLKWLIYILKSMKGNPITLQTYGIQDFDWFQLICNCSYLWLYQVCTVCANMHWLILPCAMPWMLVNVSMCVYCLAEITLFPTVYIRGFASTISVSTCGKIPWLWSYFTGFIMTCKWCFFQLVPKKSLVNLEPLYSISPYVPLSH